MDKNAAKPTIKPAIKPADTNADRNTDRKFDNKLLVRNMLENVYNKQDPAKLSKYYAEKCVVHDAFARTAGLGDLKKLTAGYLATFSNFKVVIEDQISEGDLVATRTVCSMKDTGGFMGRPATGKKVSMTATQIDRVRDGHITETWFQGDFLSMMQQLGMVPRFDTARAAPPEQAHAK